ncbi:Aldo/keto reductase [Pseudobutyrivibrio sp. 49]|uniref:aldo/keto reductase n=1 Tax=Pseudobutyrivibrio sp. 49 TaxID=1855344 RepID=UPI000890C870|nr:aldo/keto reductase [Pseudobutyrivibrio sp. 49]SDI00467.1 Aldo/keto reductase [Pseudobutyrivibrio sp. 49]
MSSLDSRIKLNNNTSIPCLGYGTYKIKDADEAYNSVKSALDAGYRYIDTAAFYENEKPVGKAINDYINSHDLKREDIFVTSKAWKTELGYEKTLKAFEKTMKEIELDYLDLYLVHWPASYAFDDDWENTNRATWKAMTEIYKSGRIKAIGVSNFLTHHLETIIDMEVMPAVNQIEINPGFLQKDTVDYCQNKGILVEAWSPLGRGKSLNHPVLEKLAAKYGKTVAQIILRWEMQHDIVPLPKSTTPSRIVENSKVFDFELSPEDMAVIDAIEPYGNSGHGPDDK